MGKLWVGGPMLRYSDLRGRLEWKATYEFNPSVSDNGDAHADT